MFQVNVVEEIKTRIFYSVTFFENLALYVTMVKKTAQPDGPQMTIWRTGIACWGHR
jgi:hypothetical protein